MVPDHFRCYHAGFVAVTRGDRPFSSMTTRKDVTREREARLEESAFRCAHRPDSSTPDAS
jgi:hypothetical protein